MLGYAAAPLLRATRSRSQHMRGVITICCGILSSSIARAAWADLTVTLSNLNNGSIVGDSMNVTATIVSTYTVKSVHADIDSIGADMSFDSSSSTWSTTL